MYLIFYDIEEDRLRKKTSDCLIYYGYVRLQLSVFAGPVDPDLFGIWQKLQTIIAQSENSKIYSLKISDESFDNIKTIGAFEQDIDYICGRKKSLVI